MSERSLVLDTNRSMLRKPWIPLAIVLVIAAETRFLGLGAQSLWFDEAFSVTLAKYSLTGIIGYLRGMHDTHPPLYYALLSGWISVFGSGEFATRSLSAVLGFLMVPFLYLFTRRIANRNIALAAAALLAGSAFAVHASQEDRMYVLLGFLALGSWSSLVAGAEGRKTVSWVLYVVTTALMLYTHYFGFLVLGSQVLYLAPRLWRERSILVPVLVAWGAVALLFSPWAPVLLTEVTSGRANPTFRPPANLDPIATLLGLFGFGGELFGAGGYFHVSALPAWEALLLPAPFLGLIVAGAVGLGRARAWLFLCYWAAPISATVLISNRFNIFYPRYFSFLAPPFAVLVAAGLDLVARRLARVSRVRELGQPAILAVLAIAVIAVNAPVVNGYVSEEQVKYDWRSAAALVSAQAGPEDYLLFVPGFAETPFDYYYKGSLGRYQLTPIEIYQMVRVKKRASGGINKAWARRLAEEHPHVWIVATIPLPGSAFFRLRGLLGDSFLPGLAWDFNSVYVFQLTSRVYQANARKQ